MILSKKRITKALIRLCGCAGWSAPVLFTNPRRQAFSPRSPYELSTVSSLGVQYFVFRFILVELRLVTFNEVKDHPCHIEVLVHSHVPVSSLHQIIIEETGIMSTKLSIFYDKSRSRDAMLPLHKPLQDLGYEGSTYDDPEELTLYYDYKVEFTDCPLLLCDHYFGQNVEVNIGKMVMSH